MIGLQISDSKLLCFLKLSQNAKLLFFCILTLFISIQHTYAQDSKKIKVVIDPGHGGRDPGAQRFGLNEKDVALNVSLLIGELLEKRDDVELVFTRKTDVFIGLKERAFIANKAQADLFVSIHANSAENNKAYVAGTFVLGLHRNEDNLKIAMRENKVIELEENYEEKSHM